MYNVTFWNFLHFSLDTEPKREREKKTEKKRRREREINMMNGVSFAHDSLRHIFGAYSRREWNFFENPDGNFISLVWIVICIFWNNLYGFHPNMRLRTKSSCVYGTRPGKDADLEAQFLVDFTGAHSITDQRWWIVFELSCYAAIILCGERSKWL